MPPLPQPTLQQRILGCGPGPEEPRRQRLALATRAAYVAGQCHWLAGKYQGWLNAFNSRELSNAFTDGWCYEAADAVDAQAAWRHGADRFYAGV